jgi:hypothetical protein
VKALFLLSISIITVSAMAAESTQENAASLAAFEKFKQLFPINYKRSNGQTITLKDTPQYEGPHVKTACKNPEICVVCKKKEGQFISCKIFIDNEFVTSLNRIIFNEDTLEIVSMDMIGWTGGH